MRRTIAAAFLMTVFGAGVAAAEQRSGAGIKSGPLLFIVRDRSSLWNASNLVGLRVGLFYERRLSSGLSLQPEIHLALKGARYYHTRTRSYETVHFNYLELPLLLNATNASGSFEVFAGPYAAILLKQPVLDEAHPWTSLEYRLKDYDLGGCLGARFWLGDLSLEVRIAHGIANVLPTGIPADNYWGIASGHYNASAEFQVGYRLFK